MGSLPNGIVKLIGRGTHLGNWATHLRCGRRAFVGRPSAKISKRPNSTIAAESEERTAGDDFNQYFRRKSQIFELDRAFGGAYVVDAANPAVTVRRKRCGHRFSLKAHRSRPM
jgi:hypothetical protein